jgi:hypothetical protein
MGIEGRLPPADGRPGGATRKVHATIALVLNVLASFIANTVPSPALPGGFGR